MTHFPNAFGNCRFYFISVNRASLGAWEAAGSRRFVAPRVAVAVGEGSTELRDRKAAEAAGAVGPGHPVAGDSESAENMRAHTSHLGTTSLQPLTVKERGRFYYGEPGIVFKCHFGLFTRGHRSCGGSEHADLLLFAKMGTPGLGFLQTNEKGTAWPCLHTGAPASAVKKPCRWLVKHGAARG